MYTPIHSFPPLGCGGLFWWCYSRRLYSIHSFPPLGCGGLFWFRVNPIHSAFYRGSLFRIITNAAIHSITPQATIVWLEATRNNKVFPFIPSRLWAAVVCFGFTVCPSVSFHSFPPSGRGGLFRLRWWFHSFLPAFGLWWFVLGHHRLVGFFV